SVTRNIFIFATSMTEPKKPFLDLNLLNRIIRLADPYKLVFYSSMVMSVVLAILSIGRPLIIIYATDHYISHFDLEKLKQAGLIMVVILVVESILRYFFNYITAWLGQSIVKDMRVRVYDHLIHSRLK